MMIGKILAAAAALMVGAQPATPVPAKPQQVYVMRHLQKAAGDDPALTQEGANLAELLAGQLGDAGIKAVFATSTRRATQTGEPLARSLGIGVTPYDPRDVPRLVAAVRAVPGNVLVVGHSNTVPELVAAFGGAKPAPLTEQDYGAIYQITAGSSEVRLLQVPPAPAPALTGPERGR